MSQGPWDRHYSRRSLLKHGSRFAGAGLLAPLWPTIAANGEIDKAYPDELLSIEAYTKGRIKTGDYITADNVEHVKDLLEPAKYHHVANMGRRLKVVPTTTEWMQLGPWEYLEATLRNQGQARFNDKGNVVAADGRPWIGGHPFPGTTDALACQLAFSEASRGLGIKRLHIGVSKVRGWPRSEQRRRWQGRRRREEHGGEQHGNML